MLKRTFSIVDPPTIATFGSLKRNYLARDLILFNHLEARSYGATAFFLSHGIGCVDVNDTVHMV